MTATIVAQAELQITGAPDNQQINAAGGVNGKKIELIVYDDGGDANKARTFATRLIEDDKVIAFGPEFAPG